jgi:hypothetical protein
MVAPITPLKPSPAPLAPSPDPAPPPEIAQNCPQLPNSRDESASGNLPTPDPELPTPHGFEALTDAQTQSVELMIAGKSYSDIALALGIARRTLYNWRIDPQYRAYYDQRRRDLFDAASMRTLALLNGGLDQLDKHIQTRYQPVSLSALRILMNSTRIGQHATTFEPPRRPTNTKVPT